MPDVPDESDEPIFDPLIAFKAELDQVLALAPEMARMAHTLFDAYTQEGFNSPQALFLTVCHMQQNPGEAPS